MRKQPLQLLLDYENLNEINRRGKLVALLLPFYGAKESSKVAQHFARISAWSTFLAYDWFYDYYNENYP